MWQEGIEMTQSEPPGGSTWHKSALLTTRIIWLALEMGQVAFLLVLVFAILPNKRDVHPLPILTDVAFIFAAGAIPCGFIARAMIFRLRGAAGRMAPAVYFMGNMIFWACCEGVTLFALVVAMINGKLWPTIIVVAIALALFALTFPMAGKISDASEL